MSAADLTDFLTDLGERVDSELGTPVKIIDIEGFPTIDDLYLEKRIWKRIDDVVVVAADLKSSTALNFGRLAPTSASLYEAVTGNAVRIVERFEPEFIDIQGDGLFAIYHGTRRYERAFCAAVSLKTFSIRHLVPSIETFLGDDVPETGLKVGMASGRLVAKRVGLSGDRNEPIWAGKPVNWATKCAQAADRHKLIVTSSVFKKLSTNDYIYWSCGCSSGPSALWSPVIVDSLPVEDSECQVLHSCWCKIHGDDFCDAIEDGLKARDDVPDSVAV